MSGLSNVSGSLIPDHSPEFSALTLRLKETEMYRTSKRGGQIPTQRNNEQKIGLKAWPGFCRWLLVLKALSSALAPLAAANLPHRARMSPLIESGDLVRPAVGVKSPCLVRREAKHANHKGLNQKVTAVMAKLAHVLSCVSKGRRGWNQKRETDCCHGLPFERLLRKK